jgi:hypothetical protein
MPVAFKGYQLFDPGAFPEPPLVGKITWRVTNPAFEPKDDEEREQTNRFRELTERARKAVEAKRAREGGKGQ